MGVSRLVIALVVAAACAPVVDGPAERQRAADQADTSRLAAQLSALPGVVRAEVLLRRPAADPLAPAPRAAPAASVVVIVDDRADREATRGAARALVGAAAPGLEPTIVVEVGAVRPELAEVGPITVEAGSRGLLRGTLAVACVLILALAGWIVHRERRAR